MALKLGAYTACLHDRPLAGVLKVLQDNQLTSVEVNTGGFIPSPHCPVDLLLSSATAREEYLATFADRGMELTGLNCNGNPLNPLPGVGPKHADDLRRTIELAGALGVRNIVTMSGTPGSDPAARYPSWVACSSSERVIRLSQDGKGAVASLRVDGAPASIAAARDGSVWVAVQPR